MLDVDRYSRGLRRERRVEGVDDIEARAPAGHEEDPLDAACEAEQVVRDQRWLRRVRQYCEARGAASKAALARQLGEFKSVQAAAKAHGVTPKAVRHATNMLDREARRLAKLVL